jgi:antitoxin component YwqK of YwqJK toxin-antitoxin module
MKQGIFKKFNYDGTSSDIVTYKDDLRHGVSKRFYENGQLHISRTYNQGELEGKMMHYYPDGQLKLSYSNGFFKTKYKTQQIQVGSEKRYYPNGQLTAEMNYDTEGKLDGAFISYYENGQIEEITNYAHGKEQGDWKLFDAEGFLKVKAVYSEGAIMGKLTEYHPDGKTISKLYFFDQKFKQPEWIKSFSIEGELEETIVRDSEEEYFYQYDSTDYLDEIDEEEYPAPPPPPEGY